MRNLRDRIQKGEILYGLNVQICDPVVAEAAAIEGYDFLRLDACHYPIPSDKIAHFILAADSMEIPVIARIDDLELGALLLDYGLTGIMVQKVQNAEQARKVVDAYRYYPLGRRNMSKYTRMKKYGRIDDVESMEVEDRKTIIEIQIEDLEGLANMDEIFSVPGIDLVCSGRNDLSEALGVPGQTTHPKVLEAEDRIIESALKAGLNLQMSPRNQKSAQDFVQKGCRVLTVARDLECMMNGMQGVLKDRNCLRK
ncbi:HpcH/HpaI aldolase family protein [Hominifimenecus sp. rT4P-3]|uniref:HpcH/HpaI aldolase family protein n=1 Tax=Hominifimenecus sp. rT4P-3 TaxID=3242979 RepID=UPI003DA617D0